MSAWSAPELEAIDGTGEVDGGSAVAAITADIARATTLRIDPR